jgi:hypothetical protein
MAWKNGSIILSVEDWGPAGTKYAKCYAKATLEAETYANTVKTKVTMETRVNGGTSKQPAVSLYLKIGDTVVYNKYWVYGETDPKYLNWPTKNGTYRKKTIDINVKMSDGKVFDKDKHKESCKIPITLRIVTSQDGPMYGWGNGNEVKGTLTKLWYTDAKVGKVSITDNGDNTFTIKGTTGTGGTNNKITNNKLQWWYAGGSIEETVNFTGDPKTISNIKLTPKNPTDDYRTVNAKIITESEHTSDLSATAELQIKNYIAPSTPGDPKLKYEKSRLTIREPWTFEWVAAEERNSNSPVAGYYIMLFKKNKGEDSFKYLCKLTDAGNSCLGLEEESQTSSNYYLRRESTSCRAIIEDPKAFGFKAGDEVKLRITAYAWNGKKSRTLQSAYVDSSDTGSGALIKNAGIIHIKVGNEWKEGQVYVKVAGKWKEAESVHTKVSGLWREST